MIIANPIFDSVFKFLMQDKRIVKFFLGTLLGKKIVKVDFQPQEFAFIDPAMITVRIYRFDFSAEIQEKDGTKTNVLIELQKAPSYSHIERFRNYLAQNYMKHEVIEIGKEKIKEFHHIYALYILGKRMPDLPYSVVKVNREYMDFDTDTTINSTNEFIEKLQHDCMVVQIEGMNIRVKKSLRTLLSIFEQTGFVDPEHKNKEYTQVPEEEEMKYLLAHLNKAASDKTVQEQLKLEQEAMETLQNFEARIDLAESNFKQAKEQAEKERKQKEEAKEQAEKERKQKEEALARENEAKERENEERKQKEIIKKYYKGQSVESLSLEYHKSIEDIKKIIE